jgi:hypothetical protein
VTSALGDSASTTSTRTLGSPRAASALARAAPAGPDMSAEPGSGRALFGLSAIRAGLSAAFAASAAARMASAAERNTSASSPFAVGASFAGAESFRSFFPSNTLAAARPAAGSGFFASALELVDRGEEAEASPAGRSAEAFARSPGEGAAARSSRVK